VGVKAISIEGMVGASPEDILYELASTPTDRINVVWDVDENLAVLLKQIDRELCLKLYKTQRVSLHTSTGLYSIFYIPGKMFSVSRSGMEQHKYYGISQYFPEIPKPQNIAELDKLGNQIYATLVRIGFKPSKLTSPIAIYEEIQLNHMDLPTVADMPYEVADYAYRASGRLWIEAFQLGYWEDAVEIDIRSAFPTAMTHLVDIRNINWMYIQDPIQAEQLLNKSCYAYCECEVDITSDISAIVRRVGDGLLNCKGKWIDVFNKKEINYIRDCNKGSVRIINGWFGLLKPAGEIKYDIYPLRENMIGLIKSKEKAIEQLDKDLIKGMAVGVYGKMGARNANGKVGKHFNPVYFAETATEIRVKLGSVLYNLGLEDYLIHVGVDGALLGKEALEKIEKTVDNKTFKITRGVPAIVAGSGNAFIGDRRPLGLTMQMVKEAFELRPLDTYYEWHLPRRVTLGEALNGTWGELGEVKPHYTSIDILMTNHLGRDRVFADMPRNGGDIMRKKFKSKAITVG
jgi:hypothetical protein